MTQAFATVGSKGQFVIPKKMRDTLGIAAGTRIAMTVEDNRIILQPANLPLIDQLCGITAGGTSMTDELLAERREGEHQCSEEEIRA
jgi:AbrB family looped-hinge helix DNA binding protein